MHALADALLRILIALAVVVLLVRLFESKAAFFPLTGETVTPGDLGVACQPGTADTSDGQRLAIWTLAAPEPLALVLYFHGNGGNLSVWAPVLTGIVRQGYSLVAFDYRGYGLSTGRPTEAGLYRDVEAVVGRFWRGEGPAAPVVYWGRSLGVTMAAYAATLHAPDGLILESGFPDVRSLARSAPVLALLAPLSSYRFPAAGFLRGRDVPALVMHGDADRVIPFAQGLALFDRLEGPKRFFTIRGGDHNDLEPSDPQGYWNAVATFVGGVPARR
jgi:fermentation-respiration switch protein FrsA (DUF1100 family)